MRGFEDADEAWLPTYGDLLMKQQETHKGVDYSKYGWFALEVPTDCTHVQDRFQTLGMRFEQRYIDRMISYETWDLWQVKLQEKMDSIVRRYDRAYALYEANEKAMDNAVPGRVLTASDSLKAGGEDTKKDKTKKSDTPSSAINDSDDYAGSVSIGETTNTYGRTDTKDSSVTEHMTGSDVTDAVNQTIDAWRDLDSHMIDEFRDLFLKVWWY